MQTAYLSFISVVTSTMGNFEMIFFYKELEYNRKII